MPNFKIDRDGSDKMNVSEKFIKQGETGNVD